MEKVLFWYYLGKQEKNYIYVINRDCHPSFEVRTPSGFTIFYTKGVLQWYVLFTLFEFWTSFLTY